MGVNEIREFLGWCTVINGAVLAWWFAWFALAHDVVYRLHGRWFTISAERFDAIHYGAMAAFKLAVLGLNLAPYLALRIIA